MAYGFKDFTAGAVLAAADLDDYCVRQGIMQFDDATARDAAVTAGIRREGMVCYLLDINAFTVYDGAAWVEFGRISGWTSYTTTWSGTLGNGTKVAYWNRKGREITYRIKLVWGSTTSHAAATQTFTLPVAPHGDYTVNAPVGYGTAHDLAVARYGLEVEVSSGSTVFMTRSGTTTTVVTNTAPFTWGTGDEIYLGGTYESAA